jgi:ketosteroid isomerase-like protein
MNDKPLTSQTTLTEPTARWSVGGLFIEALANRDFEAMAECLDPDARLRALMPPGHIERRGRDDIVGQFRAWFGGPDELELVDATVGEVGSRLYLRWRLALTPVGGSGPQRTVEQHVFATTGDHISALDLLCSGFVSQPTRTDNATGEVSWPGRQ